MMRILATPKISGYEKAIGEHGTEEAARKTFDSEEEWAAFFDNHKQEKAQLAVFRQQFPAVDIVSRDQLAALIPQYAVFAFLGGDDQYKYCCHTILRYNQQKPEENKFVVGVNLNPKKSVGALLNFTVASFLDAQQRIRNGSFGVNQEMVLEARVFNDRTHTVFPACSEYCVTEYCDANARKVKVLEPERLRHLSKSSSGLLVATPFGRQPRSWYYNATLGQGAVPYTAAGVALREVGAVDYGTLYKGEVLQLLSKNDSRGVIFADGHQEHFTPFPLGSRAEIRISDLTLAVVQR